MYSPDKNPNLYCICGKLPQCMKNAIIILVIIVAVLACGCIQTAPSGSASAAPSQTPADSRGLTASAQPNLIGTWTGPMQGYDEGTGFTDYPHLAIRMLVAEQHGRLFSGTLQFNDNGTEWTTEIAGAIGRDNRTLTVTQQGGGYSFGEVVATDEIELTYVKDGSPYHIAVDSFKRV